MKRNIIMKSLALMACLLCSLSAAAAEAYACYTSSNTTLTFYYDDQRASRTGQTYDLNSGMNDPGWYTDGTNADVTKVVFNSSFGSARPTSTYEWFYDMNKLQTITGISYLKTDEVTNMGYMFRGCTKLTSIDVSRFNTSNVIYMLAMFYGCRNLLDLDLRNFNTSNVTSMAGMFSGCNKLSSIDVSNFNTANVTNMALMFDGCHNLTTIYAGSEWSTAAVTISDYMFLDSPHLVGGQGTTYDVNHLDVSYAHIDGGPSNPGYFSEKGPEPYACFTEGNRTLTFYYDTQRRTREGTTYDLNTGTGAPGWRSLGSNGTITKVVFDPSFADARPTSTHEWFYYMTGLTSITGISYLNTSQVTNMKNMFFCCNSLTSLDVSHFNTANVTTMYGMFRTCSSVTSLDVSNFNTANVTDMTYMFDGCSSITSLDVSNFNTANVTTMNSMFDCYNLASLDVSGFNTAMVTDMSYMFSGCRKLTSLDVSNFNTAKVTNMRRMFYNCVGLTSLDLRNFNTAKVTDMYGMFASCSTMTSLDLRGLNTSQVTDMTEMFYGCTNLVTICVSDDWTTDAVTSSLRMFTNCTSIVGEKGTTYDPDHRDKAYAHIDGGPSNPGYLSSSFPEAYACYTPSNTTLTFYYDNQRTSRTGTTYNLNTGGTYPDWYIDGTKANVTKVVFDPSFADFRPTTTYSWFCEIFNLQSITGISYLNTSEVTSMSYMFYGCSRLTSLDVSHFNTSNVTSMSYMFYNCSRLTSLDVSHFNTSNVTSMSRMFVGCTGLTELDLSSFNPAYVFDMEKMFYDCNNLRTIFVGNDWSTAAVTSSGNMFYNCTSLVGGQGTTYNSSHVDKAYARIDGGPSNPGYLTDPDVLSAYACYTPSNTTLTFYYDKLRYSRSGTTYNLNTGSDFPVWLGGGTNANVTKVVFDPSFADFRPTTTYSWFDNMLNLQSITGISNLNTSEVTSMTDMFYGCSSLTSLDVSGFNTAKVTNMIGMFAYCESLTSLDVSHFNTSKVTSMSGMFAYCKSLTSLDVSHFNTSKVTNMNVMFAYCESLTSLDVSNFNTSNVNSMTWMFEGCNSLTSLDVSHFNTSNVIDMRYMFAGCTGLTELDLSSFKPAYVFDMEKMFYNCNNLRTIYVGNDWSTAAVTSSGNMFYNCTSLVGGKGTTYDANHIDATYAHIDGGPNNPGYLTDVNAPAEPEAYAVYTAGNTTLTFYCDTERSTREGTTYDLNVGMDDPGWDIDGNYTSVTHVVFDPSFADARPVSTCSWFWGMSNLQSITGMDCMNTEDVTTMWGMFTSCSSLTTLDLSSFNTSKVINMLGMFSDCSNLTTIYAGEGWSMATVSVNSNMFTNCTKLVGGKGTTYNPAYTNGYYARIDGGPSNPGYFTDKNASQPGDVNGDTVINVADVTALIQIVLNSSQVDLGIADLDGSGTVNVADVTKLIHIILDH